jgi:phosphopantothenoylcysteine decarboxylase/phosphopantothenate--cysteine ligase
VRFIGNRSSGRMGFAVAAAAAQAGARVTLVAGPVCLPTPPGVGHRIDVRSAQEMHRAVLAAAGSADIFVAAAAVGDYRPAQSATQKLKKQAGAPLTLELTENPDILASVAALPQRPFLLGFAAETHDLERYARDKLQRKGLDMIAANRVGPGQGFEAADNALSLYWADGTLELARASKTLIAAQLIEQLAARYRAARGARA